MSLLSRLAMIGVLIGGYKIYQDRENQKYWKQYEGSLFNSESEGEKVRNRLQGSDVGPEDDMLETPSIYRDWPMVQKGYQSLRMMNDNDNFNSESFSSEWHYFSECETKGCDGSIEYRDVYACPSCGQDDVEILLGDTCPDCGETAEDVSKYAIFYCSDCGEDYTDEYNSESFGAEEKMCKTCGEHEESGYCDSCDSCYGICECDDCDCYTCKNPESWGAETYSGKKLNDKIDAGDLTHIYPGDYNNPTLTYYLQLTDAEFKATYPVLACQYCGRDTKMVEVSPDGYELTYKCDPVCMPVFKSAEGEYRKCTICEEPAHPLYRGKGALEGARRICYSCNKKALEERPSFNNVMIFDADEYNAYVYRGKPMEDLNYSQRAMATKKMIDAADLEGTMLQLENAIRMGLISEDELMKELQNKFGSK